MATDNDQYHIDKCDLRTLGVICKTLESIISGALGPRGLQSLVTTDTGQLLVTNDSLTILRSLHLSHPIAKLIIESLTKTVSYTGDGGKTFVIILSQALDNIEKEVSRQQGRKVNTQQNFSQESFVRIRLCKAFHTVLVDLMPEMIEYVIQKLQLKTGCGLQSEFLIEKVIHTVINTHFPVKITDVYTKLLMDLLEVKSLSCYSSSFVCKVKTIYANFDKVCIKINHRPYTASTVIESFIIQRNFAAHCPELNQGEIRFLILQGQMEGLQNEKSVNETIHIVNNKQPEAFMLSHIQHVENFIKRCKQHDISLVLCTEKVPDFLLNLFTRHHISVIHYVLVEDIEFLQHQLQRDSLNYIHEEISKINICCATSCQPIIIGDQRFVHLTLPHFPKTLLICGLSDGLCQQVVAMLHKTLRTVIRCFNVSTCQNMIGACHKEVGMEDKVHGEFTAENTDSSQDERATMGLVVGGGLFEMTAAKYFEDKSSLYNSIDSDLKIVCKILSTSLLSVTRALYTNSSNDSQSISNFIHHQQHIFRKLQDDKLDSLESASKYWCPGSKNMCIEPVSIKIHMIHNLIQLLQQLLRIDSLVGVSRK